MLLAGSRVCVYPHFTAVREKYMGDSLENTLRISSFATNDENVSLFFKVQDFIIKSKRFEQ